MFWRCSEDRVVRPLQVVGGVGDRATDSGGRGEETEHPPGFWGRWRCSDLGKMEGEWGSSPERRCSHGTNEGNSGSRVGIAPYLGGEIAVEKQRIPFGGLKHVLEMRDRSAYHCA